MGHSKRMYTISMEKVWFLVLRLVRHTMEAYALEVQIGTYYLVKKGLPRLLSRSILVCWEQFLVKTYVQVIGMYNQAKFIFHLMDNNSGLII